jgi:hypothetical protein
MNKRFFLYALLVTGFVTIVSWVSMIDEARDNPRWRSNYGGGGYSYGGGGGHK